MRPESGSVPFSSQDEYEIKSKHKPQGEGSAGTPALPAIYLLFEALMQKLTYPCCELLNITNSELKSPLSPEVLGTHM